MSDVPKSQPKPFKGGFRPYRRTMETEEENVKISTDLYQQLMSICHQTSANHEKRQSATERHKEKNYNKNFIKSIGVKIIEHIKKQLPFYLKAKGIENYDKSKHMGFLDAEEKMSVLFFKSLMCTFPEDDEEMQVIKKINRTLGFNYLKKCAQKDIYRKNKIIAENQGAYLLHCKILEKKLTNPSELDFLC